MLMTSLNQLSQVKQAILNLVNKIKKDQTYPEVLEVCDISSIFKNKSSRNSFENYRGIFRVPIFRTILDRLIYNDVYLVIDEHLRDSNFGAGKKETFEIKYLC